MAPTNGRSASSASPSTRPPSWRASRPLARVGGVVLFVGVVRDFSAGRGVDEDPLRALPRDGRGQARRAARGGRSRGSGCSTWPSCTASASWARRRHRAHRRRRRAPRRGLRRLLLVHRRAQAIGADLEEGTRPRRGGLARGAPVKKRRRRKGEAAGTPQPRRRPGQRPDGRRSGKADDRARGRRRGDGRHGRRDLGAGRRRGRRQGGRAGRRPARRDHGGQAHAGPDPALPPAAALAVDVRSTRARRRGKTALRILAVARCSGQTGVEMEAMTAASVAALTVYDMCKAADRWMAIREVRLLEKRGGKSGAVRRPGRRRVAPARGAGRPRRLLPAALRHRPLQPALRLLHARVRGSRCCRTARSSPSTRSRGCSPRWPARSACAGSGSPGASRWCAAASSTWCAASRGCRASTTSR